MIQSNRTNHGNVTIFVIGQWDVKVFSVKSFNVPIDWSYLGIFELYLIFNDKFANNTIVVLFHS